MPRSGINRGFSWLRKVLQVTEETESPSTLGELVRPTMDVFGWERLAPFLVGAGPTTDATTGADATDIVILEAVPAGVMRYVLRASCSHDDPGGLVLSMQVRSGGVDIALQKDSGVATQAALPFRLGLERCILMAPGEQLLCRSSAPPAALTSLFIRYHFVDIDFGEYIPPIS